MSDIGIYLCYLSWKAARHFRAGKNRTNHCFFFIFLLWQDKVALGALPYKEEIEDLKMQLVKIDLEKKENAKEFEKEYVCLPLLNVALVT